MRVGFAVKTFFYNYLQAWQVSATLIKINQKTHANLIEQI